MTTTYWTTDTKGTGEYAEVNGINLYYETMGDRTAVDLATRRAGDRLRCSGWFVPGARRTSPVIVA